ncbi:MAG: hypothetical protein L0271_11230 [Gemmatimonadetes bacterium]|nr:hypothetical protein [Gemmatimonadota bacterium]
MHVDASFDQSFTSVEPLASPIGVRLSFAADRLVGPLGVQLTYRYLDGGSSTREQICNAFFCEEGPFDVGHAMSAFGLGLTMSFHPFGGADLVFALNGSLYRQTETTTKLAESGTRSRGTTGPDPGIGASADLRFPVIGASLRPLLFVRFDRIASDECLADAACWGSRTVRSIGAGVAWWFGPKR